MTFHAYFMLPSVFTRQYSMSVHAYTKPEPFQISLYPCSMTVTYNWNIDLSTPALSTPVLSTVASSCYVVHSHDVHSCFVVPLLNFRVSTLAFFSAPVYSVLVERRRRRSTAVERRRRSTSVLSRLVSEVLSLIYQNLKMSRGPHPRHFRGGLSSYG